MSYGQVLTDLITTSDGVSSAGLYGFKNRIINGAMQIDQRNAGASVTPTANTTYTLDRWNTYLSQASKFSVQQSTTVPAEFKNSLLVTSLSAYTVGSSETFAIAQRIEGLNTYDLDWGTANAKTVTLSFWVRSSLTGTFGGAIKNSAENRAYPFSYTISSANTYELKTITIAGDTSGTWLTTNGVGITIVFSLGTGSTVSGTVGAWGAGNLFSATGATSVVGTSGATFYITGVQLEKGSAATSFDYRPYTTELQLCQRYYAQLGGYITGDIWVSGYAVSGFFLTQTLPYQVSMRANPTATRVGSWTQTNVASFTLNAGISTVSIQLAASSVPAGITSSTNGTSTYITLAAEL